jgi:hypothetical protein
MQSGTLNMTGVDIVTIPLTMKTAPGIYLLNIKNEARRFAKKIMVK